MTLLDPWVERQHLVNPGSTRSRPVHVVHHVERVALDVERHSAQMEPHPSKSITATYIPRLPAAITRSRSRSRNASSNRSRSNLGLPSLAFPGPVRAYGSGTMHGW